jgi:multicomponent Na+:H+ antiporter subunit B
MTGCCILTWRGFSGTDYYIANTFISNGMEVMLSVIIGFMIIASITAIHAKDLLSAIIAQGFVGYGLVICFLMLRAPDLAIMQIVMETVTLIIMVAVVLDSSREGA